MSFISLLGIYIHFKCFIWGKWSVMCKLVPNSKRIMIKSTYLQDVTLQYAAVFLFFFCYSSPWLKINANVIRQSADVRQGLGIIFGSASSYKPSYTCTKFFGHVWNNARVTTILHFCREKKNDVDVSLLMGRVSRRKCYKLQM